MWVEEVEEGSKGTIRLRSCIATSDHSVGGRQRVRAPASARAVALRPPRLHTFSADEDLLLDEMKCPGNPTREKE